jgi:acyl carrier protein
MEIELKNFIQNIASALEDENIKELGVNVKLEDIDGWDSFAIMSVIAMIDEEYNVIISGDEISKIDTLQKLYDLIRSRMI